MPNTTPSLLFGCPGFPEGITANQPHNQSALAAWKQLLDQGGIGALRKVTGDFAVAFQEADGRTFLAIDRFAIQTLCYRIVDGVLKFAARADELADATTEIDPQAIYDFLYFHIIPSPRTIYKGVFRVPPAHYVLYENGQLTVAPYWTAEFNEVCDQPFEKLRDEFRDILLRATERQLDGGKAGCFLSGGTDSSTIAGMIAKATGGAVATYSIGFEAEGYDEMAFARIASRRFNTEHHEYYVTPDDLVRSIPLVAQHYDQPFGNSSALPAYYCARMAKENGITRILAGDGGDELFGGNTRYAKQRVFNWYQSIPGAIRRGVMEPALGTRLASALPLIRKASSYVEQAKVPMPDRDEAYNLIVRLGIDQVLTDEFLKQVDISSPLKEQRGVWSAAHTDNQVNRGLAFDWRYTLAECDLPKVCGTVELAGLNVGFPMLDNELLDFSLRLPAEYKLKGLKLRWFFKEALREFLPDEILTKKKQGFGLPFGVWVTRHEALRKLASESVHGLVDRGILRRQFADTLLNTHLYEHPGYYGEMIWISMMLEQWFRGHSPSFAMAKP
ncbi:MAG: asparagine synthase [Sphingomonadales bacterium]|nr:asparagine synthase [Sphingomonadales bacterium]